jgi:hypothetical protein
VVPWSRMGRLPHEIFSILPGALPHSLALRRAKEEHFAGGLWIGIDGRDDSVPSISAGRSQDQLSAGIVWNWYSERRDYTMVQVWGVQAVPLGAEKFVHMVQTNGRGPGGCELGLMWYLEKQSGFYRFARRLHTQGSHETHVLFASCAGQLLCRAAHRITGGSAAGQGS